jgi:hypothetical protein
VHVTSAQFASSCTPHRAGCCHKDAVGELKRTHALDEALTFELVGLPADLVVQRVAHALGERLVVFGAHTQPLRGDGDVQPCHEGPKLGLTTHQLSDSEQRAIFDGALIAYNTKKRDAAEREGAPEVAQRAVRR